MSNSFQESRISKGKRLQLFVLGNCAALRNNTYHEFVLKKMIVQMKCNMGEWPECAWRKDQLPIDPDKAFEEDSEKVFELMAAFKQWQSEGSGSGEGGQGGRA